MAFNLPSSPAPRSMVPRLFPAPRDLRPINEGPIQRTLRLGIRYAFSVDMPPMEGEHGLAWSAAMARGLSEPAILAVRQPGLVIGSPGGNVQVDGGGQQGSRLALRGLTAGYAVRAGQFFHLFLAGRHYLHRVTEAAAVSGSGQAVLSIAPMLRVTPPDGGQANFLNVKVEGFVEADGYAPSVDVGPIYGLSFTLTEAE